MFSDFGEYRAELGAAHAKSAVQMNIQLAEVISDVMVQSGQGRSSVTSLPESGTRKCWRGTFTSLSALLLASAIQISTQHATDFMRYRPQPPSMPSLLDNWLDTGWRTLPAYRTELDGDVEDPLVLQWVATDTDLINALEGAGWNIPAPWTLKDALLWLLPHPPIEKLPVLPQLNRDSPQAITLSKVVNTQSRLVVRLWLSGREGLAPSSEQPKKIWQGTVTLETLIHPATAFTTIRTDPDIVSALHALEKDLASRSLAVAWRARGSQQVLLVW